MMNSLDAAKEYMRAGILKEAVPHLEAAVNEEEGVRYEDALGRLIYSYAAVGRCDKARALYDVINVNTPYLAIQSLEFAVLEGDLKTGLHLAEIALKNDAYASVAHERLGILYSNLQDWSATLHHMTMAVELDPSYTPTQVMLARAHLHCDNMPMARLIVDKLMSEGKVDMSVLGMKAELLAREGDPKQALQLLNGACMLDDQPGLRVRLGLIHLQLEQDLEAESQFSLALSKEPDYIDALIGRSEARFRIGNSDDAESDLNRILQIAPRHVKATKLLAFHRARRGNLSGAVDVVWKTSKEYHK